MAKIDILLTYWGDFGLLKKTVESVFAQTETDWTLRVFDDAYPTDEAKKYFATIKDKRVTYIKHEKNIGITNNFNFAVKSATAKHCVLLGCDDKLLPTYIEAALSNIGKADMYQPGVEIIDANDTVYIPVGDRIKNLLRPNTEGIYKGEKLAISLSTGNWLYFPSILWKTKTIQKYGFDIRYKIAEDLVLIFNIIKDGGILLLDNDVTFQYRRFADSLSSREKIRGGIRFNEENEVYSHFAETFKVIGWKKAALAARLRVTSRLHQFLER
jgi:glycosyltransferase involved in cell wall biosynthesis